MVDLSQNDWPLILMNSIKVEDYNMNERNQRTFIYSLNLIDLIKNSFFCDWSKQILSIRYQRLHIYSLTINMNYHQQPQFD